MSEKIIGFKAFDNNLTCRGFKYEIGKVYKHKGLINPCISGFHFCETPLSVLNYYQNPFGQKYAIIEASGEIKKDGDKTVCSEIKIIKEISYQKLFDSQFEMIMKDIELSESTQSTTGDDAHSSTTGYRAHSSTSGDRAHSSTTGYGAHSSTTGNGAHSSTSGNDAYSSTTGNGAHSSTSGNDAHSSTTGYGAHSSTTGYDAHSSTTGYEAHSSTTGNDAHSSTTGYRAHSSTSGDRAHSSTTGYGAHSSTTGDRAHSSTTGYGAHSSTTGDGSISCSLGIGGSSKVEKGWLIIVDWFRDDNYDWHIKKVYSAKVGQKIKGTKIKTNTWYWFENGELKYNL